MEILNNVVILIEESIGIHNFESGGILGGKGEIVTNYVFDRVCLKNEYIPDVISLNDIIIEWGKCDIAFLGLIHSHETNNNLSYSDIQYAVNIVTHNKLEYIYMLIYVINKKNIYAYKVGGNFVNKENINYV